MTNSRITSRFPAKPTDDTAEAGETTDPTLGLAIENASARTSDIVRAGVTAPTKHSLSSDAI